MSFAVVRSRGLQGLAAPAVTVEVHLANGLPSFTLVGLADTEVKEARERVRSAIVNSGLDFPNNKKIVVNLAPADLPKDSGRFDLPIALGILAASGQIDAAALAPYEFAGELSLSGDLRSVRGALAMSLSVGSSAEPQSPTAPVAPHIVLPMRNAQEAAFVQHRQVYGAGHLLDVVQRFLPSESACTTDTPARAGMIRIAPICTTAKQTWPDLADVKGQNGAKRALEIAAAGGHSLLMVGPPGSGKSMLAHRFAGLLPPLSQDEALESAAILDIAGRFKADLWGKRAYGAPHHTASAVALVGGGSPPRPGEISLAHNGVLFLDELPEFARAALEALREPLESGTITISRAARRAEFPARFQLIAAMNPCPCGYLGSTIKACRCTPDQVMRYQGKLSGPLMDRIDLHVEVPSLSAEELLSIQTNQAKQGATQIQPSAKLADSAETLAQSPVVAERVAQARERAIARQGCTNNALQGQAIDTNVNLDPPAAKFLGIAATRLGWSGRSTHRALKVARTIADLSGAAMVQVTHISEAMQYRRVLEGS